MPRNKGAVPGATTSANGDKGVVLSIKRAKREVEGEKLVIILDRRFRALACPVHPL